MSEVWTKLVAKLTLDPSEYQAGAKQVSSATTALQGTIMKAAGAMGIAFSGAAVLSFAKDIAKAADATVDAARGLDITTASLVGLQRVAARSGTDGETVIKWMQKLADVSADLAMSGGTNALGKQLEAMGINVREFLGLPLPERLLLLIQKSNESSLGVSALNASLGKAAAIDAKDAYTQLAKDGLGSVADEANRAAKAVETLASVWGGGQVAGAGLKAWGAEKLADIMEVHRRVIQATRDGKKAPKGALAITEGIGSVVTDVGLTLAMLIPPLRKKLVSMLPGLPETGGGKPKPPAGTTDEQREFDQAEGKRERTQKEKSDKSVRSLRDAYVKIISASLEGEAKLRDELVGAKIEYLDAVKEAEQKYQDAIKDEKNQAVLDSLKFEYDQTLLMLEKTRDARVASLDKQIREAKQKEKQDRYDAAVSAVEKLNDRISDIKKNTRGTGVSVDSMASVGGFMGGERPGLAAADRQLRVQEEILRVLKDIDAAKRAAFEGDLNAATGGLIPDTGRYY